MKIMILLGVEKTRREREKEGEGRGSGNCGTRGTLHLRMGTLIVGTITGKGKDMMGRRKVDILCLQETNWKRSKARNIEGGCKLFYNGVDKRRNGMELVVRDELVESVGDEKGVKQTNG